MATNMNPNTPLPSSPDAHQPRGGWKRKLFVSLGVIAACCAITAAATAWWVKRNIYASPLRPVNLTQTEQEAFDQKVAALSSSSSSSGEPKDDRTPAQRAADEKRTLVVTDREINAFLAKQGLGEQVRVELADGSIEATALVPMDKDLPWLGGKTLRLRLALSGNMDSGMKPAFQISDVSIGGVPLPNAWLGDVKGVNLLASNVGSDPVVKQFLAGIREFEITKGTIRVMLNE